MHLIFTLDGLHFIYFKSKEHLELTFIYTVYFFFLSQQMSPTGTLLMCLSSNLQGDIPGTSYYPHTASSVMPVQLTSAGLPVVGPLPGQLLLSLGCPLCLAHSSCFPFISWLHCLQRAWEFSNEAVISILHSWQFSCQMGVFLLQHPPPACSWIASGCVHGSQSSDHVTKPELNSFPRL